MMDIKKEKPLKYNPTRMIVLGFFIVVCIGTILLALPIASADGKSIGLLNALFTATSATCVTGLVDIMLNTNWRFRIYDIYYIRTYGIA